MGRIRTQQLINGLIVLLLCAPCFGQAWTGILSSSRAIDWTGAGLPSTITYGSGGAACDGAHANCVETILNPWTPPTRVQCGSTIASGASVATINVAYAACLPGSEVRLGVGSFSINANLVMRTNGVSIRGAGGSSTILNFSGGAIVQFGVCCGTNNGVISGSYAAGVTSITMTGASGNPPVNQIVDFNQCDLGWTGTGLAGSDVSCTTGAYSDPGKIWPCGIDNIACSQNNAPGGSHNYQHQLSRVTSVVGTCSISCTLNFTPGLYMPNWGTGNNPKVLWQSQANWSYGVGLENVALNFPFFQPGKISTQSAHGWWVKGTRIIGDGIGASGRIDIGDHSSQGLLMSNYMFQENANNLVVSASEGILRAHDTGTLILNNIFTGGMCLWGNGKMVGEVIAYNYCRDSQTPDNTAVMLNHNPYESFSLFEGNVSPQLHGDNTHGTNDLNTYFRNYNSGYDQPYVTTHARAFLLGNYNRFYNYIGNAVGGPLTTTYQGSDDNGKEFVIPSDSLTVASLMRWGNCDVVTATCRFQSSEVPNSTNMPAGTYPNATAWQNATPANNNLPCSFFLPGSAFTTSPCVIKPSGGTGLSWWRVCTSWTTFPTSCATFQAQPFPPVGPDQSGGIYVNGHAYDIPAAIAYQQLPIDTALQNSFTITASSWSNNATTCAALVTSAPALATAPCEILTVSLASINNGSAEHIMGGFQLSGVNAACIPAGINFSNLYGTNEILMTGSSTTQIAYALASDPGVACTGTLKFPNIRKFDQQVYATDALAVATPVISPGTGSYSGAQTETITTSTGGASIYYTIDGTTPDNTKTLYSGSFLVSTTTTIKAIAILSGVSSGIDTEVITITGTNNNLTTTVNHVVLNHVVIN